MKINVVFFDMDGVLSDWNRGVANLFKINYDDLMKSWTPGIYKIEDIIGETTETLWKRIDEAGVAFWSELSAYEEAKCIWDYCISLGLETYILSSPSTSHALYAVPGKILWLRQFTGNKDFSKAYFSTHKELLAQEDRILIDDYDKNINKFRAAGGQTILFPRRWNSMHHLEDSAPRIVKYHLDYLLC